MCLRRESLLAPEVTAPRKGREFVAAQCRELGLTDLVEIATLLTSELVTNVVVHTRRPATLGVTCSHGELVVDVGDADPRQPPPPGDPNADTGESAGGRGLTLVAQLADDWGVRPIGEGDGKAVWFALRSRHDHDVCGCGAEGTRPSG
jgi:anti-sigma regulatory factor (Ser/Thr protein kinase)